MKKLSLLFAFAATMFASNVMAQKVVISDVDFNGKNTAELVVSVEADSHAALVEFVLALPEGITVEKGSRGYKPTIGAIAEDFSATIRDKDDGTYYVLVYSSDGYDFLENSGEVLKFNLLKDASTVIVDNLTGKISNIILSDVNAKQMNTETEASFVITDNTTVGINDLTIGADNQPVYTVGGQRVASKNLKKGIYVVNGKKVTVK